MGARLRETQETSTWGKHAMYFGRSTRTRTNGQAVSTKDIYRKKGGKLQASRLGRGKTSHQQTFFKKISREKKEDIDTEIQYRFEQWNEKEREEQAMIINGRHIVMGVVIKVGRGKRSRPDRENEKKEPRGRRGRGEGR